MEEWRQVFELHHFTRWTRELASGDQLLVELSRQPRWERRAWSVTIRLGSLAGPDLPPFKEHRSDDREKCLGLARRWMAESDDYAMENAL